MNGKRLCAWAVALCALALLAPAAAAGEKGPGAAGAEKGNAGKREKPAGGEKPTGKGEKPSGKSEKPSEKPADKPAAAKSTPAAALTLAMKALEKAESYRVGVSVEGGLSDKQDHEVTETTVRESYEGEVFRTLMYVPSIQSQNLTGSKAFRVRTTKKGVAFIDGVWRNILAHRDTTLLDRLFSFPEALLERAMVPGSKAEWVKDEEEEESMDDEEVLVEDDEAVSEDDDAVAEGDEEAESPQAGRTVARKSAEPKEPPPPHIVRVEVPPKEALTHFTEVQNSGCMSGG